HQRDCEIPGNKGGSFQEVRATSQLLASQVRSGPRSHRYVELASRIRSEDSIKAIPVQVKEPHDPSFHIEIGRRFVAPPEVSGGVPPDPAEPVKQTIRSIPHQLV